MKNITKCKISTILVLLFFSSVFFKLNAQNRRYFANFAGYGVSDDFKKGNMFELGGGVEFEVHPLFKPEIELSYFFMGVNDQLEERNNHSELQTKKVSSVNLIIGPKIYFWFTEVGEDIRGSYFITPRFSMSRIMASGNYYEEDYNNPENSFSQKSKIADWQHSFGFAIGREFPLPYDNSSGLALSLSFNKINMGKTLNRLPYNQTDYNTVAVGASISYYF